MDLSTSFQLDGFLLDCLVISAALVLDRFVRIHPSLNPVVLFRFLCFRISQKVNAEQNQQALIAGSLSLIVLLVPSLIIFMLIHAFASLDWLLNILLLTLLLSFQQDKVSLHKSAKATLQNKKALAKNLLQNSVLRDTEKLSPLGLYKAVEESLFLRYHHQVFAGILCFLLLGPVGIFIYRLSYEAQQIWSPKLLKFKLFSYTAKFLTSVVQLPSSIIFSLSILLVSSPKILFLSLSKGVFWQHLFAHIGLFTGNTFYLFVLAQAAAINTGGPVMYGGIKYYRPRFTKTLGINQQTQDSSYKTFMRLLSIIERHLIFSMLSLLAIAYYFSI